MTVDLDSGYGWVVVFASYMIQFIGLGMNFTFGLFFAAISKDFPQLGKRGPAWIPAIMGASAHAVGPIASILVNRFDHRRVSIVGSVLCSLGFSVSYFAQDPTVLYLTIGVCAGIGLGLMYLPAVVVLSQYFDKKLAPASCIASAGSGSGTFFFEWTLVLILANYNWREAFLICGVILLLTIPMGILYRPLEGNSNKLPYGATYDELEDPWDEDENVELTQENPSKLKKSLDWSILKNPLCILFATAEFFTSFGYNVPHVYLPEIEQKLINSDSNTLLAFIAAPMVVTRLSLGYFSRKEWLNRRYLYTAALGMAGIATAASPHLHDISLLRLYCAIYGSCMGIYIGLKSAILASLLGNNKLNESFGIMLLVQSIGMLLGAPIAGYLYDTFGSYAGGFYFAGVMFSSSAVVIMMVPLVQKKMARGATVTDKGENNCLNEDKKSSYLTFGLQRQQNS